MSHLMAVLVLFFKGLSISSKLSGFFCDHIFIVLYYPFNICRIGSNGPYLFPDFDNLWFKKKICYSIIFVPIFPLCPPPRIPPPSLTPQLLGFFLLFDYLGVYQFCWKHWLLAFLVFSPSLPLSLSFCLYLFLSLICWFMLLFVSSIH